MEGGTVTIRENHVLGYCLMWLGWRLGDWQGRREQIGSMVEQAWSELTTEERTEASRRIQAEGYVRGSAVARKPRKGTL